MDLITDLIKSRNEIEKCIKSNGFAPEHNYGYYKWLEEPGRKNIFIKFPRDSGILAQHNARTNTWYFISLPIAEESDRLGLITDSLGFLLETKKAKKVMLELPPEMKQKLAAMLKNSSYSVGRNNYVYYCPIFDMKKWDGDSLSGKTWKKLRNIRNRFYKLNKVIVKDSREITSDRLRKIVKEWVRKRTNIDKPFYHRYLNMIAQNFDGVEFARTLIVNDEPCTITAGWRIPNSNDYYSGIGIYNYKYTDVGEIANLDDLVFLKSKKFEKVDFGGSGPTLLRFKKKFQPSRIYKTLSFPIVKRG